MSSRALKKLQGGDELQPTDEDVDNLLSSGGEEDPDLQTGKGKTNFFDLVRGKTKISKKTAGYNWFSMMEEFGREVGLMWVFCGSQGKLMNFHLYYT